METLSRLFLKKDEDLVYTEDLSALTAKQLTDLKELEDLLDNETLSAALDDLACSEEELTYHRN